MQFAYLTYDMINYMNIHPEFFQYNHSIHHCNDGCTDTRKLYDYKSICKKWIPNMNFDHHVSDCKHSISTLLSTSNGIVVAGMTFCILKMAPLVCKGCPSIMPAPEIVVEIRAMATDTPRRGHGTLLVNTLIQLAESFASSVDVKSVKYIVLADLHAIQFYKKLGFIVDTGKKLGFTADTNQLCSFNVRALFEKMVKQHPYYNQRWTHVKYMGMSCVMHGDMGDTSDAIQSTTTSRSSSIYAMGAMDMTAEINALNLYEDPYELEKPEEHTVCHWSGAATAAARGVDPLATVAAVVGTQSPATTLTTIAAQMRRGMAADGPFAGRTAAHATAPATHAADARAAARAVGGGTAIGRGRGRGIAAGRGGGGAPTGAHAADATIATALPGAAACAPSAAAATTAPTSTASTAIASTSATTTTTVAPAATGLTASPALGAGHACDVLDPGAALGGRQRSTCRGRAARGGRSGGGTTAEVSALNLYEDPYELDKLEKPEELDCPTSQHAPCIEDSRSRAVCSIGEYTQVSRTCGTDDPYDEHWDVIVMQDSDDEPDDTLCNACNAYTDARQDGSQRAAIQGSWRVKVSGHVIGEARVVQRKNKGTIVLFKGIANNRAKFVLSPDGVMARSGSPGVEWRPKWIHKKIEWNEHSSDTIQRSVYTWEPLERKRRRGK